MDVTRAELRSEMVDVAFDLRGRLWAVALQHGEYFVQVMIDPETSQAQNHKPVYLFSIIHRENGYQGYNGEIHFYLNLDGEVLDADVYLKESRGKALPWVKPFLEEWARKLQRHRLNAQDPLFRSVHAKAQLGMFTASTLEAPTPVGLVAESRFALLSAEENVEGSKIPYQFKFNETRIEDKPGDTKISEDELAILLDTLKDLASITLIESSVGDERVLEVEQDYLEMGPSSFPSLKGFYTFVIKHVEGEKIIQEGEQRKIEFSFILRGGELVSVVQIPCQN